AVARVASRGAGLIAGAALALMPVAALMFRFNNPDAVMVLLMTAGAYCTIRALRNAQPRWLLLAGVALGFAFLAKMLEGLMVLPALGLAYLIVAPTTVRKRIVHLLGAAATLVISSGWYVLLTLLWPAATRPYLAGSTDNNFMNLVLGYNGLARVLGRSKSGGGAPSGHPAGAAASQLAGRAHGGGFGGMGSQAGITRLFTGEIGFEISWLLPAALLAIVLVFVARGRRPRTDLIRGAAIVFAGWLVVDGLVLSFMNGTMHAYYTLAIAPAIAGVIGLAAHEMWRLRDRALGRFGSAALVLAAGVWGFVLLQRNSSWMPWLCWTILAVTVVAALGVIATGLPALRRLTAVLLITGVIAGLGGSAAYAAATITTAHTGGSPSVGPASTSQTMGGFGGQSADNPQLDSLLEQTVTRWSAAIDNSSPAASLELASDSSVMAIGGFSNDPTPTLSQFIDYVKAHQVNYYVVQNNAKGGPGAAGKTGSAAKGAPATAGQSGKGGANSVGSQIGAWVAANFKPMTVGSATVYDLSIYNG
ncbi:MAG: glycosyltransferase family 39 protein, partial [Nocardia sp.]|nr:glycosyltransferase family 39 protein [Nocardia sp.]